VCKDKYYARLAYKIIIHSYITTMLMTRLRLRNEKNVKRYCTYDKS